jgi:hypothetical protein
MWWVEICYIIILHVFKVADIVYKNSNKSNNLVLTNKEYLTLNKKV